MLAPARAPPPPTTTTTPARSAAAVSAAPFSPAVAAASAGAHALQSSGGAPRGVGVGRRLEPAGAVARRAARLAAAPGGRRARRARRFRPRREQSLRDETRARVAAFVPTFRACWLRFDPYETGVLARAELAPFLAALPSPLGCADDKAPASAAADDERAAAAAAPPPPPPLPLRWLGFAGCLAEDPHNKPATPRDDGAVATAAAAPAADRDGGHAAVARARPGARACCSRSGTARGCTFADTIVSLSALLTVTSFHPQAIETLHASLVVQDAARAWIGRRRGARPAPRGRAASDRARARARARAAARRHRVLLLGAMVRAGVAQLAAARRHRAATRR